MTSKDKFAIRTRVRNKTISSKIDFGFFFLCQSNIGLKQIVLNVKTHAVKMLK